MPVTAFACPPDKKKFGETHDIEYCCTECTEQCYSPFMMAAIYGVNQRNHHKGRYVSATALSGCKRRLQLERTVDYAEHFSGMYAAFRGTITHTVVEEAMATKFPSGRSLTDLGFVAEWSMIVGFCLTEGHGAFPVPADVDVDDLATYAQHSCPACDAAKIKPKDQEWVFLGGTLDGAAPVFDPEEEIDPKKGASIFIDDEGTAHFRLSDIKTMKEYALSHFVKGDAKNTLHPQVKDDYVKQARVYAYLASRSQIPDALKKLGVKKLKMVRSDIQAFAMGEAPWTGGGTFRWKDHWRNPLKDWPMYPIDLGTDEWVENYIRTEARPILNSLILGEERGAVRRDDQAWLCTYCAFQGSELCPNPELEAKMLRQDGITPERAFKAALAEPMDPPNQRAEPLTEKDTSVIDAFFAWKDGDGSGPAPVTERLLKANAKKAKAPVTKKAKKSPAKSKA
jgi:hypothetical protein